MTAHRYHSTHGCTWANPRPQSGRHGDFPLERSFDRGVKLARLIWRGVVCLLIAGAVFGAWQFERAVF